MPVKMSDLEIDQKLAALSIKRFGDYFGVRKPIEVECLKCEYHWTGVASCLLYNDIGCPRCNNTAPLSNEEIDKRLAGRQIIRITDYIGANKKMTFRCSKTECLHQWTTTPSSVYGIGTGCPKCRSVHMSELFRFSNDIIDQRLKNLTDGRKIQRIGDYILANEHCSFRCLEDGCGYEWATCPKDYGAAKMRVCKYTVLSVIEKPVEVSYRDTSSLDAQCEDCDELIGDCECGQYQ